MRWVPWVAVGCAACIDLVELQTPSLPDSAQSSLVVAVPLGASPRLFAFDSPVTLDRLTIEPDTTYFALYFDLPLASLGLQAGSVALPGPNDLQRPIPPAQAEFQLDDGDTFRWREIFDRPASLSSVRLPGGTAEGCAEVGGCFLDETAFENLQCTLECRDRLDFDVALPTLALPPRPPCPDDWRQTLPINVLIDTELEAFDDTTRVLGCEPAPLQACAAGSRQPLTGPCQPLSFEDADWRAVVDAAPAVLYVGEAPPAGAPDGPQFADLEAALAAATEAAVVSLAPGSTFVAGVLPQLGSLTVVGRGSAPVRVALAAMADGRGVAWRNVDLHLDQPTTTLTGTWTLERGRMSFGAAARQLTVAAGATLRLADAQMGPDPTFVLGVTVAGTLVATGADLRWNGPTVVEEDGRLELVNARVVHEGVPVVVRGTITVLEGATRLRLVLRPGALGRWTRSELDLTPAPFAEGARLEGDAQLEVEGGNVVVGLLGLVAEPASSLQLMTTTLATEVDGAVVVQSEGEVTIEDSGLQGAVQLIGGTATIEGSVWSNVLAPAALLLDDASAVVRTVVFDRVQSAVVARRGFELRLEDALIQRTGCEPFFLGPPPQRNSVEEGRRQERPCVRAAESGWVATEDDYRTEWTTELRRVWMVDDSEVSFLKSAVQSVGTGSFRAQDVILLRSPGRAFLFQGPISVDLQRVVAEDAVPNGACFFPGLRFEPIRVTGLAPSQSAPSGSIHQFRASSMDVGVFQLVDPSFEPNLTVGDVVVEDAEVGVVRARADDKLEAVPVPLERWLVRGAFLDVVALTGASQNEACD
jgi:hypothetical protein